MTGYAPSPYLGEFSIRYGGDIWIETNKSASNYWTNSAFDNLKIFLPGYTGGADFASADAYSWVAYGDLTTAIATNRTVTLIIDDNFLNTSASNPIVSFYWGNGATVSNPTLLESVTAVPSDVIEIFPPLPSVPEPSSLALAGLGVACGVIVADRRRRVTA
jgi:hypothetical protein